MVMIHWINHYPIRIPPRDDITDVFLTHLHLIIAEEVLRGMVYQLVPAFKNASIGVMKVMEMATRTE